MCIRDRVLAGHVGVGVVAAVAVPDRRHHHADVHECPTHSCLLYTSDAADERSSVALGGRRIIKKKKKHIQSDSGSDNQSIRQEYATEGADN